MLTMHVSLASTSFGHTHNDPIEYWQEEAHRLHAQV